MGKKRRGEARSPGSGSSGASESGGRGGSAFGDGGAGLPFSVERAKVGALPVWGWGLASAGAVWVLYVVTLAPTTAFWDASEYIATAHILGLPHPPGNPLFVAVGRVWDVLLAWTGQSVAWRINLLSATASAVASGLWFLAVARIWSHFCEDRRQIVIAAFVSVLVGATAFTVWSQSNVNEKVYTLSFFVVALVTYLAMLWEDVADSSRGDRLVLLVAFILGLGATNHLMSVLPLGALGAFVLWHRPRTLIRPRLVGAALALAVAGYSFQVLFVPIRSGQNPMIDEADPGCESLVAAVVTPLEMTPGIGSIVPDDAVCEPLRASLAREQYGKRSLLERQAPFRAQLANYGQYFDWQWARSLPSSFSPSEDGEGGDSSGLPARGLVTFLFFLLGVWGLWIHWKGDRDSFVYFFTLLVTVIPVLVWYLNFKYGYSMYPEIGDPQMHEVRERDYFYILSFNLWGLYAGMGIAGLWRVLAGRLGLGDVEGAGGSGDSEAAKGATGPGGSGRALGRPAGRGSLLAASPVLLLALLPLFLNWGRADRSGDYSARDWAYNLLQSVEPYGVLFTNGDNDTFPLWYLQEVEGVRQDVTVIVHSYLGTKWYPKQLLAMTTPCPEGVDPADRPTVVTCQRPFDGENAIGPYRDAEVSPPTRPILDLTEEEIDQLGGWERVDRGMTLRFSEHVVGRLDPAQLRSRYGFSGISQGDALVFVIARNTLGDRPVYFAATAPPVFGVWNVHPQLLRQGLAFKLEDSVLESTTDTVRLGEEFGIPWVDLDRTSRLLWEVYQVDYLLDWELWPEPSTRSSIPAQYYLAYYALGEAQRLRDMPEAAERSYTRAEEFLSLGGLGLF